VDRRAFIGVVTGSLLAAPLVAEAQQAGTVPRIGVLTSNPMTEELQESFRQGLRDHGYIEGKNTSVEWRAAGGRSDLTKTLAVELVRSKVDVIVAIFTPAVQAAKDATSTIPIVMAPAGAPVATGLVAKRIRVQVHIVDVRRPHDIDAAFAAMTKQRADAVIVQGVLTASAWQTGTLAMRHHLPALSVTKQFAQSGGLMSYSGSFTDIYRRGASYVDRILKGSKPADLPVEQPTKFELVINLKTARALGVTVPSSLVAGADQVIE